MQVQQYSQGILCFEVGDGSVVLVQKQVASAKVSVRRLPGSGQVQCTSWRNFALFSSSTFKNIHGAQAGKRDRGGSEVGARHIVPTSWALQRGVDFDVPAACAEGLRSRV